MPLPHPVAIGDPGHVTDHNDIHQQLNDLATAGSGASVTRDEVVSATVATSETTTSGTFVDLATVGPTVNADIGASGRALVIVQAALSSSAAGWDPHMGFAVSGASTVAAALTKALRADLPAGYVLRASATFVVTGLTAGVNTFTAKYRIGGGNTGTFADRTITVIPL